ncbi:elongin BC and Polycomb repressive complex 2-associated protein [Bombina bombina]|uniref:elongin BC and Polycomb repressive complex 2-associated protein n=1 Tax=Bombina bombina TaxID=8345 RepID=UPI00235A9767|nr:elongin BC and Polycomb repressive complex 2-associated protein [Bombina bombina]
MEPPAGYQEIDGMRLGYLRVGGRQLFALAQVLSGPLRGVPRGRVCRRMERLQIQIRRCDLRELRALKALRSVPSRAVQCCLISREDLHILCSSRWGPKEGTPVHNSRAPGKDCISPRIRTTLPQGIRPNLTNLFQGSQRSHLPGHSPATSVGYSSPSDHTSSSDNESDSSEERRPRYRPLRFKKRSRSIGAQARNSRKPKVCTEAAPSSQSESVNEEDGTKIQQSKGDVSLEENTCKEQDIVEESKDQSQNLEPPGVDEGTNLEENPVQASDPEPRIQQFDRLVRQSKLWCYARGFRTDSRDLLPRLTHKARTTTGSRRVGRPCGRMGQRKKKTPSGRMDGPQSKRLSSTTNHPIRPAFSFLDNFPVIPSLVVGEDGDLNPACSLRTNNSKNVSKAHPVWGWHLGGNAIPLPPSLKFRTFPLDHL